MHRIHKIQHFLKKKSLPAVLITQPFNVYYLCGYIGTKGYLLITPKKATLLTDSRYYRQAKKQIPKKVQVADFKNDFKKSVGKVKIFGFEERHLTWAQVKTYQKILGKIRLKPISGLVEELRSIKDASEMKILRKAVKIAEQTLKKWAKTIKIGVFENELEWNLLSIARGLGADGFSFPPIICFGKNTADVHHAKEPNRLKKGEHVLIDFGIKYKGYCTDMTRVFFTRKAVKSSGSIRSTEGADGHPRLQEVYETVLRANLAAIQSVRAGKKAVAVDKAGRKIIEKAGFGPNFGHGMGHGIGLEVHEYPSLSPESKDILRPGMVFTIEPGIYQNNLGGIRIEDMVSITDSGKIEILTKTSREIRICT